MSMYSKDRKCNKCEHVWEVYKARVNDAWPEEPCPNCGENDSYIKMGCRDSDVGIGSQGNASTGYSKGIGYHPSKYGRFSSAGSK